MEYGGIWKLGCAICPKFNKCHNLIVDDGRTLFGALDAFPRLGIDLRSFTCPD